jgi:3-phosphoshikimate 1-carboxyvinyltransferase
VPGDKSTTQRALLLGAVAEGETRAYGALDAGDTRATAEVVAALGARVAFEPPSEAAPDGCLVVRGAEALRSPARPLDCRNAGTSARLLLGLLAGRQGRWTLDGDASLRSRPMGRVTGPLARLGADIRPAPVPGAAPGAAPATAPDAAADTESDAAPTGDAVRLPLSVRGVPLRGGRVEVALPSAQVKSALLLAGLVADAPLCVVQHVATRDHTERLLPRFGIALEREPGAVTVRPGRPRAAELDVPGDPSSAAFLVVAGLLAPDSDVWVRGVGLWPRRTGFLRVLARAGADVMVLARDAPPDPSDATSDDPVGDLRAGTSTPGALQVAPEDVPDLVDEIPILALAAARAEGRSRFAGLAELRVKESDRVAGIAALLAALGVPVETGPDTLTITGVRALRRPARWPPLDDHRLALTAAVAAAVCGWPLPDVGSAQISFPGFVERLRSLSVTRVL